MQDGVYEWAALGDGEAFIDSGSCRSWDGLLRVGISTEHMWVIWYGNLV